MPTDKETTRNHRAFDVHDLLDDIDPNTPRWGWVRAAVDDARRGGGWRPVHIDPNRVKGK